MLRVSTRMEEHDEQHPILGKVHTVSIICYDEETGQDLTDEQIYAAFMACDVIGVAVKIKIEHINNRDYPSLAMVTDVTSEHVWLGSIAIPKATFHNLYELD